ncbi:MAG TPA: enolase C-terminal domain-like protein [Acidimicrobiia bacterium]
MNVVRRASEVREHRLDLKGHAVTLLEGPAGWGEISPLPGYPCDPASARAAAEEAACAGWPEPVRDEVTVNALVESSAQFRDDLTPFPCVKVKVGRPELAADVALVAGVRQMVGPSVAIRVDANGAWDEDTAVERLRWLAEFDLELAEQPVADLDTLARVRRQVPVPVAADECIRTLDDARRLRALDAADAIVLKVQPLGGVRAALRIADAAGVPAIVTSMMETSVGLAAGLALACALPELPYACGLGTGALLYADVVRNTLLPEGGVLRRRTIVPEPRLLARYGVRA